MKINEDVGSTTTSDVQRIRDAHRNKSKDKRKEMIKKEMESDLKILRKKEYESTQEYFVAIEKSGYRVHIYNDKESGQIRGYGLEKEGVLHHASDISRKYTLKELSKAGVIKNQQENNLGY